MKWRNSSIRSTFKRSKRERDSLNREPLHRFVLSDSQFTIHESHGTLLVVDHDRAVCRRSYRDGAAGIAGNDDHSRGRDHSPSNAWSGKEHRLVEYRCPCSAHARNLCARFSQRLLRRKIFWRDEMGYVRRYPWCAHRHCFWNHRIVCWTGYWCDSRRIYRREEDDRRWPSRLGELARKSRWDDRQACDRARHDHDFLCDCASTLLNQEKRN